MNRVTDRDLWALAAGALDPGDALAVAEAVAADPAARLRLDHLRRTLEAPAVERWRIPSITLPSRGPVLTARVDTHTFMAGGEPTPGDRVVVQIPSPPDASVVRPLIVREVGGRVDVVYPESEDEWVTLDAWPIQAGFHEVDVVLDGPPGRQRFVVALIATTEPIDWAQPLTARWEALRAAVEEGRVPAALVEVTVA